MNETAKTTIRWQAYEREHIERGGGWYLALGVTAFAIAVVSVILHDPLFAVLILVAAVALGVVNHHPPILSTIEISERGVRINSIIHYYDDIRAFWVEDGAHAHPTLFLQTRVFSAPHIAIPLDDAEPTRVRAYLLEHIEEVPMREPLAHQIIEFFGF